MPPNNFLRKYLRETSSSKSFIFERTGTSYWPTEFWGKNQHSHPRINKSRSSYAWCFTYFLLSWMLMRKSFVWMVNFVLLHIIKYLRWGLTTEEISPTFHIVFACIFSKFSMKLTDLFCCWWILARYSEQLRSNLLAEGGVHIW